MTIFAYIALKDKKETVKGKIEANTIREARSAVTQLGLLPIKIYEETKEADIQHVQKIKLRPLSLKEKIDFTTTFQTLGTAGVSVVETLVFMENDASSARIRALSKELRRQIMSGSTFADTVKRYQELFGPIFVGLTKAGEDSGEMEATMGRIIELLKKQDYIKQRVISALIYPAFVIILAILVILVMLVFVFPRFAEAFAEQGRELPPLTQICIVAGDFLTHYWYAAGIMFLAIILAIKQSRKWPPSRRFIDRTSLKIPLIGDLLKYGDFSNYLAVLQVAYDAGVPIVNCLILAAMTIDNYLIQDAMNEAKGKVQQGLHLSIALRTTKMMPKMLLFMISTGEQSGKLGSMLQQAVNFVDNELDKFVEAITKAVEPVMLVVLGFIVLFFALALYIPLFNMIDLG